jgi:hypothetical protein
MLQMVMHYYTLIFNQVYVICLLSHATVWGQANDNGSNCTLKHITGDQYDVWFSTHQFSQYTKSDANMVT